MLEVVDTGGLRAERRKWITCLKNCTNVLYFVSLSDFDQAAFEDRATNRMEEALIVWKHFINVSYTHICDTFIIHFIFVLYFAMICFKSPIGYIAKQFH